MKSETILSIRKARKKYFDEIKADVHTKISPKLKEELSQKNTRKEKPIFSEMISNHIRAIYKNVISFSNKFNLKVEISFPIPFKKHFLKCSNRFNILNKRFEQIQERIFTFLVVLFDAEELLIPEEVYTKENYVKTRVNRYFQKFQLNSPEILTQQIERLSQQFINLTIPLKSINLSRKFKPALHIFPQNMGDFLKKEYAFVSIQMRTFYRGTGQRE